MLFCHLFNDWWFQHMFKAICYFYRLKFKNDAVRRWVFAGLLSDSFSSTIEILSEVPVIKREILFWTASKWPDLEMTLMTECFLRRTCSLPASTHFKLWLKLNFERIKFQMREVLHIQYYPHKLLYNNNNTKNSFVV